MIDEYVNFIEPGSEVYDVITRLFQMVAQRYAKNAINEFSA